MLCCTFRAQAQWAVIDPSNLVQNIQQVVSSSSTLTNMIKNVQESIKIYEQSKAYYDALKSVANLIKDARKVQETVAMVSEISQIYATGYNKMLTDRNFSIAELEAISRGYAILLRESGNLVADIKDVVSASNGLSMSDAERMAIIDRIYNDMKSYRNLVRYFSNKNISISYLRSREKGDMDRVRSLYGEPSERYW